MAVSVLINCDRSYCRLFVNEGDSLTGWWVVITTDDEITISPLCTPDFKEPVGQHFCSMDHATAYASAQMAEIQRLAIEKEHAKEEVAELEIVATVYSQDGDVEKPDENQA